MVSSTDTTPAATDRGRPAGLAPLVVILATAAVVVAGLLLLARLGACPWSPLCGPLLADDIAQSRLDTALPAPQGELVEHGGRNHGDQRQPAVSAAQSGWAPSHGIAP